MPNMSLNDVCVYIPAWFGAIASVFTGLIAYECSLPLFDIPIIDNNDLDTNNVATAPYGSILDTIPILSWLNTKIVIPLLSLCIKIITLIFGTDFGLATQSILPDVYNQKRHVELSSPALEIGLITAAIMCIVPAHMMRSVGGGYDNESIANTAMTMTFYFWCRALRGSIGFRGWSTVFWAIMAGIAYFYVRRGFVSLELGFYFFICYC